MILSNRLAGDPHTTTFERLRQLGWEIAPCFLCGKRITDPAIMWAGEGGAIYFHARCATSTHRLNSIPG